MGGLNEIKRDVVVGIFVKCIVSSIYYPYIGCLFYGAYGGVYCISIRYTWKLKQKNKGNFNNFIWIVWNNIIDCNAKKISLNNK
jgi:hypothetical protein